MRRKSLDERQEVPSLIEKVIIYDKPNKPSIPKEILAGSVNLDNSKGDIVLSIDNNKPDFEKPATSSQDHQKSPDLTCTPSDDFEVEGADAEETIENISKEISKYSSPSKEQHSEEESSGGEPPVESPKKVKRVYAGNKKADLKETGFKRPRGRPKKSEKTSNKVTILNYVIKQFPTEGSVGEKDIELELKTECQDDEEENREDGVILDQSDSLNTRGDRRGKRTRRVPKKYDNDEVIVDETFGHYSSDEVTASPPKKKKYTELTLVPLFDDESNEEEEESSSDDLINLCHEGKDQTHTLDSDEGELHDLVAEPKPIMTKTLKTYQKKTTQKKITEMFKSDSKSKERSTQQEEDEQQENQREADDEEDYDSEDSRQEWVPEEYIEYKKRHAKKISKNKMFKCKFCDADFTSYYGMRKHRALEHDDVGKDRKESTYTNPDSQPEDEEPDDGDSDEESRGEWLPEDYAEYKLKHNMNKMKRTQWYKCKICCAVFSNYYKLSKHRVEHDKPNPYECKHCSERFGDIDTLAAHIRQHQGKDPYACKKCEKGFKTKEDLSVHMSVHVLKKAPALEKKFRCDICGKEFGKLCDIERHTRVHTGEKPCECNICHKKFQQAHNLSKHLLTHLHVKPFQCEICNKKFGRIDVLNRHLLTHSLEKPFKCDICAKGFIREVQLTNHLSKSHLNLKKEKST